MEKIAIIADSGCQIPIGSLEDKGVFVVPLQITIGDTTYVDRIDMDSVAMFEMIRDQKLIAKTSQPATGMIQEAVQKIKRLGYSHIIGVTIGSGLSSTINGFKLACDLCDMPVTLVDSKASAMIHCYLVQTAKKLSDEGKEPQEIKTILESLVEYSDTFVMAQDMDHLKRGGRITPAVAALAGMLKITPVMHLNHELNGRIDSLYKVRTAKKANIRIVEHMVEDCHVNNTDYMFAIEHVLAEEMALEMKELLLQKIGPCEDIIVRELPAVVGVHLGTGGLGYQYIKKYQG